MLQHLITSRTKRSLLKLFLTNPERAFYTREISKLTGEPLSAVRRELGHLEEAGLLKARTEGNLRLYQVVPEFPFFGELKRIIYGTIALGDRLRESLAAPEGVKLAFVYGSVARDEETGKSDIDLFVVGEIDEGELRELVEKIESDTGREVNYTLMAEKEFADRIATKEPFVSRVLGERKLALKGDPDVY